ncbi:MAG: hypothetical protein QXT71_06045, partial [Thermoplasmata archaeon]
MQNDSIILLTSKNKSLNVFLKFPFCDKRISYILNSFDFNYLFLQEIHFLLIEKVGTDNREFYKFYFSLKDTLMYKCHVE